MKAKRPIRVSENADPHELNNPVPKLVLGVIAALVVWGVYYIFSSSPNSAAALGDQRPLSVLAPSVSADDRAIDGKQLYTAACQACHQASGQGLPGVFPPLAGSEWVTGDPAVLAQIVLHGVTGPITVSGATYNGAMPAFGKQFDDAQIAAVLSFIRSEWGNASPEVDEASVQAARAASEGRTQPWEGQEALSALTQKPAS
ncbi:c-type cytochrome [Castellaniella sp. S9]|uniref:c-type cytochrome n=1 Tax=Castellaniella sp. S9 TaxID=2993652 RepID=UPI0022B46E7A|nr:cytochrome c [Castellaniella sp. S9]